MMSHTTDEDIVLKVIVMGSPVSRKSGVVARFITDKYLEVLDPTIEDSYHCRKKISYNNETKNVSFSLLDVSLNYNYTAYLGLAEDYTRESNHFAFVYSIDSYESFHFLEDAIKMIAISHEFWEDPLYITVIGNECHLRNSNNNYNNDKLITKEDGLKFASKIPGKLCQYRGIDEYFDNPIMKQQIDDLVSVSFWEVSEKSGLNIEKAFINHFIMKQTFEQFESNPNAFKMRDKNKLLLICFGFCRFRNDWEKVIPKGIIIILHEYLDGLFWNDNETSYNQCNCCVII